VRVATGHLVPGARAQCRRHSLFTTKASSPQHSESHSSPFPPRVSILLCPVVSCLLSSWRPASNSAFLLRGPHQRSLPRPHHSLARPSFAKRLVLRIATTALPTQQTYPHRHRTTTKPRARSVCNLCSPPASTCHLPAGFPTLRFPFADSPISPGELQSRLPTMSRTTMPTGAKTRLMSELKTLRKENWINFEDVS
jgi:hypothetical protein